MPNVTACSKCGTAYEAGTEEQANEHSLTLNDPNVRLCAKCRPPPQLAVPAGATPGYCSSCRAPILWVRTGRNRKAKPLDRRPRGDGNMVIENELAVVYQPLLHSTFTRYMTHFATCPQGAQWSKGELKR